MDISYLSMRGICTCLILLGVLALSTAGSLFNLTGGLVVEKLPEISDRECYVTHDKKDSAMESHFCYPSVVVAGFPKCGTSFMFKALAGHPSLRATRRKEMCLGGVKSESWEEFLPHLSVDVSPASVGSMQRTLSGCLHTGANVEAAMSLAVSKTKYIFVVRHVADMLWAAYNYWCIPQLDSHCKPGQRTAKLHHRSPEGFHNRILAGLPMGGGIPMGLEGNCFKPSLKRAISAFGRDNVVVVKSEDMLPTLDKEIRLSHLRALLSSLGLDSPSEFEESYVAQSILVNSGYSLENRGEFVSTSVRDISKRNVYEISDYKPMLEATREHLEGRWKNEQAWLRKNFGIEYGIAGSL